jgi:EmrB/QacA subfamily drug resistance transporter
LVVGLDLTILNTALPTISRELRASTADLQWMVDAYTLAFSLVMLPAGQFGDRWGQRKLLLAGLATFCLGSVLAASSGTATELVAARAVMGLSAGFIMPLALAIVPSLFPADLRPKALAFITVAIGLGLPLGPIAGGALLSRFSWGSVFWVNVPIAVVAFAGVALLIPASHRPARRRLDLPGAIIGSAALTGVVYGLIRGSGQGWRAWPIASVLAGLALLVVFFAVEQRQTTPLVDTHLFQDKGYAWGTVAGVGVSVVLYGLLFTLPQFFQSVQGFSALSTGLRLVPLMVGLVLGGLIAGIAQRALGARVVLAVGLSLLAAGALALAFVSAQSSYVLVAGGLAVSGFGVGCAMTPAMDSVLGALPDGETGSGAACNTALRQVGGALAVAVLGGLLSSEYARRLSSSVRGLSPFEVSTARRSVEQAMALAQRLGGPGKNLVAAASSAYAHGMSAVMIACAITALAATILCAANLSSRPVANSVAPEVPAHA